MNNYRGITLLTNFNKIFEILIWLRLEEWWSSSGVISNLQGACRKGQSCVHSAFLLQETVSTALDDSNNVFVAYFDVSKAFDTVWVNGLFYKMYEMGIRGKTWRLLYRSYLNFMCKVRISDMSSDWYEMMCGIHQGGFLSLIKYVAFINQLIINLRDSDLCCKIDTLWSTPPGYADDIATACLSKHKMDEALKMVNDYGKRWRFSFNAKKSAILVYGENEKTNSINSSNRMFKLGCNRVLERKSYDHVGIKACLYCPNDRVTEKICKGRRAFNACSGVGIRKNGLTMMSCNIIFWGIVIPIVTFGAELWYVTDSDYDALSAFQRHIGRRIQRFPSRSPNCSSFFGLGWLRITTLILVKKLLFALSILRLDDLNIVKQVFITRVKSFHGEQLIDNHANFSPTYDMLKYAKKAGVYNILYDMTCGNKSVMTKHSWSKLIWSKAWQLDDLYWKSTVFLNKNNDILYKVISTTKYLPWWELSDKFPSNINMCEKMARLVCHASKLKSDDVRLKSLTPSHRICDNCDMYSVEDLYYVIMQCPNNEAYMRDMLNSIVDIDETIRTEFENKPGEVFSWLIGKSIPNVCNELMLRVWLVAGEFISYKYSQICRERTGVG